MSHLTHVGKQTHLRGDVIGGAAGYVVNDISKRLASTDIGKLQVREPMRPMKVF